MNRRDFIKKSIVSAGSLATIGLLEKPLMAYGVDMAGIDQNKVI